MVLFRSSSNAKYSHVIYQLSFYSIFRFIIILKQCYRNPLALDGGLRQQKIDICDITILLQEYGNQRININIYHKYHIVFVCKYRKKLLVSKEILDYIKQFSYEICTKNNIIIKYMEADKDYIYYMIETESTISLSKFGRMDILLVAQAMFLKKY